MISLSNAAPDGKLTIDMVTSSLLNEEVRRKSLPTSGSHALVSEEARGRSRNRDTDRRDKSRGRSKSRKHLKCYYCDKTSHMKKDCWKLKKDLKNKDNKDQGETNTNVVHDDMVILSDCENDCLTADCDASWVVDSGSSYHATPSRIFFTTYEPSDLGIVKMKNSDTSKIVGLGDVHIVTNMGYRMVFKNIRHIPDLRMSLLSTGVLDDEGFGSQFAQGVWKLMKSSLVVAKGKKCCSLYKTETSLVRGEVNISSFDSTADLWHHRLGHMSEKGLETLKKLNLLPKVKDITISPCDHCLVRKQRRTSFASTSTRKSEVLELVHSNVCGPMEVKSLGGSIYFALLLMILLGRCGLMA